MHCHISPSENGYSYSIYNSKGQFLTKSKSEVYDRWSAEDCLKVISNWLSAAGIQEEVTYSYENPEIAKKFGMILGGKAEAKRAVQQTKEAARKRKQEWKKKRAKKRMKTFQTVVFWLFVIMAVFFALSS